MLAKSLIIVALVCFTFALGTKLHINSGCIRLNGEAVCAEGWRNLGSSAKIEAKFSGNRDRDMDTVGCAKDFHWPANFGDVFFGDDSCLYDSKGQNIDGQCCDGGGGYEAKNPYRW